MCSRVSGAMPLSTRLPGPGTTYAPAMMPATWVPWPFSSVATPALSGPRTVQSYCGPMLPWVLKCGCAALMPVSRMAQSIPRPLAR